MVKLLTFMQGLYYLITGVWPFISMASFQAITGPKVDGWLVKMVGALAAVIGGVMLFAGIRHHTPTPEVELLATSSAVAFMGIDVTYAGRKRISPIYLVDAILQVFFLSGWFIRQMRKSPSAV